MEHTYKEKKIIDIKKANLYGVLLIIPIVLIYGIPFYLIWGKIGLPKPLIFNLYSLDLLLLLIIGIIIHELIHGITWSFFIKNGFRSIKFGIMWKKMMTPYCHSKELMKVKHYILGAIMPAIIIGFLPAIYAIISGSLYILFISFIFTLAAIGDFMVIYLLKDEDPDSLVEDHPSEAGCYVYKKTPYQTNVDQGV